MIMTLANYDVTKTKYIKQNCNVIDYVKYKSFKNYENYLENEYYERSKN